MQFELDGIMHSDMSSMVHSLKHGLSYSARRTQEDDILRYRLTGSIAF